MKKNGHIQRISRHMAGGFLLPALIFLVAGTTLSLLVSREEIHMVMNGWHGSFQDFLFRSWTRLGEAWILIPLGVMLIPYRPRIYLSVSLGFVLSGLLAQLFKRLLFSETARPVKYFEIHSIDFDLYTVPGVDLYMWKSFPSGHTAAAFGVFFAWALFLRSPALQFICFLMALGVAYSRIYLSQHFLMDTVGGAFLGMGGAWLSWYWLHRAHAPWLDFSMIKRWKL